MKIKEVKKDEPFMFTKLNGNYAVKVDINNHMQELFEKHREEGFICCGFDWCTLIIAFIDDNEKLKDLWQEFDYDPSDYELYIMSEDERALQELVSEFKAVYDDTNYFDYLMSQIDYR